ncbi:MAG: right-handed parallel beta-helix repeat-containing protein, partial [Planctomycetaceae bacterium]|nr:right-handed parallel beta-helix repeat-containing protein [Planctomycetaceae bacterium]
ESPDPGTGLYDFLIRIEDEQMKVTGIDGSTNVLTVERGFGTSVAGSHGIDLSVQHDSMFLLEGADGRATGTGVYSGGGTIQMAQGAIRANTISNNSGAGLRAELPANTVLLADVAQNVFAANAAGGFVLRAIETNQVDHGSPAFKVEIGGDDVVTDANLFDANIGAGVAFTLVDQATGTFDIRNNTLINTIDDNDTTTNYVGDAIHTELIGETLGIEATNVLQGSVIDSNSIGTLGASLLAATINSTQATIAVEDSARFDSLTLPFNVQIGREELTVTGIMDNNLDVVRGVSGPNEAHGSGDGVFSTSGGNLGRGFALLVEEDSAIEDLFFTNNTVVNNADDGFKLRREDEGSMQMINQRPGQSRAVTIRDNTFIGNGFNAPSETLTPSTSEQRGAGIDIHAINGSIDLQDLEIVGNVIEGNLGTNTSGILLRAEADARILVDIEDNRIRYNAADGIELSSRENDSTDVRQVGGTWTKNTITDNGDHGIQVIGRHGLFDMISELVLVTGAETVVTPLSIGVEGVDPVDGKDRGNIIESNNLDGITVNATGFISFSNNSVKFNGTGGVDIDPVGSHTMAIKANDISQNVGTGIDINVQDGTTVTTTIRENLIRNNVDSDTSDAVINGDAIELRTSPGVKGDPRRPAAETFVVISPGLLHLTATGNFIEGNDGRGIDLLNLGVAQIKIGDPALPMDTGRNHIVGNRHEGIYVVNTADSNQAQDVPSTDPLLEAGPVGAAPDIMLHVDTNTLEDNGQGTGFTGTGLVVRAGSVGGGSSNYNIRDNSGDTERRGGEGSGIPTGVGSNDGDMAKGNGRINARIANNTYEGNYGNDFVIEAFKSTVDPPTTTGTWNETDHINISYFSDPLSRVNLVFTGNTGNGLINGQGTAGYANAEPDFKSRQPDKTPPGPWISGTRERSACLLPDNEFVGVQIPPGTPPPAQDFMYPAVGPEQTWRVLTGFDTVGAGPFDAFDLGSDFSVGGGCGWDIGGTELDGFVSERATTLVVEDAGIFVGGAKALPGNDMEGSQLAAPVFSIQVGLEEMAVEDVVFDPNPVSTKATLTVRRGHRGTPILSHLSGTAVGMFTFPDPELATFPVPGIVDVTPEIRNTDAGIVDIKFSEDMQNVGIDDFALAFDDGTVNTSGVITGATHIRPDGTKDPVTITSIGVGSYLVDGDQVTISGILGNGAANGVYSVSNVTANTFDLGVDEVQMLELTGAPTAGTFTLEYQQPTNEVQRIEMAGLPMDGHFALGFRPPVGGTEFTEPLEYDATAAEVQAALEGPAVPTIDPGDVLVAGGPLAGMNEVQEIEITGAPVGGD